MSFLVIKRHLVDLMVEIFWLNLQDSEKEYSRNEYPLCQSHLQPPYFEEWNTQQDDICKGIWYRSRNIIFLIAYAMVVWN